MKSILLLLLLTLSVGATTSAQQGRVVSNIELKDLDGRETMLPMFGQKNLLVFYVDPDRAGQNDMFVRELKSNEILQSGSFHGFNILNVKDAPMAPNGVAHRMARKRAEMHQTTFLIDDSGAVSKSWKLGDCDNYSVVILLSITGEILFVSKGRITDEEKTHFYEILERFR